MVRLENCRELYGSSESDEEEEDEAFRLWEDRWPLATGGGAFVLAVVVAVGLVVL